MSTKVEVWTQSHRGHGAKAKCVWRGEMDRVPVPGEFVVVHDGWCSETVVHVHHNLYDGTATVEIRPDFNDEYPIAEPTHG